MNCWVFVTLCTVAGGGEHQVKMKQKKVLGLAGWLRKAAVKASIFLDVLAIPVWLGIVYWALSFYLLIGLLCSAFPPVSNCAKKWIICFFFEVIIVQYMTFCGFSHLKPHTGMWNTSVTQNCSAAPRSHRQLCRACPWRNKLSGEDPNGIYQPLVGSPAISCACGFV